MVFEPQDFLARLVAAIPPPRAHLLRFHGVLAPNAKLRSLAVPRPPAVPTEPVQLRLFTNDVPPQPAPPAERDPRPPPYKGRHPWAQLMRHVFAIDVTTCVHCQGRMTRFDALRDTRRGVIPAGVRLRELCTTPEAIARAMAHPFGCHTPSGVTPLRVSHPFGCQEARRSASKRVTPVSLRSRRHWLRDRSELTPRNCG